MSKIDYSKWDNLELSDDSDVEVHPNVDKRSFIRWKQRDIHEKRDQRSLEKASMKNEQIMNDKLLSRIETLLLALRAAIANPEAKGDASSPEEFILQTLLDSTTPEDLQKAPVVGPPNPRAPTYADMLTTLADKVSKEIPKNAGDRWKAFEAGFQGYYKELSARNDENKQKLEKMEREDARKITSSGLRDGFNTTHVVKADPAPAPSKTQPTKSNKVETVEILNPGAASKPSGFDSVSSGAEADIDEEGTDDDEAAAFAEAHHATKLGKEFGKIKSTDLGASISFILKNMSVLAERESDGLLIEAFNHQAAGKDTLAKQHIHQALLLQYCRTLGGNPNAVQLFFKRITTANHTAQKAFYDDVNQTYNRIRERSKEIASEKGESKDVEQIQLHAVDPNSQINITVPPAKSDDPELQAARKIFETFPPGFQRALETGNLDRVNEVLGKMSVSEAEEIVEKLSEGGMLSLEEGVIDGTTEEGRARLAELESGGKKGKEPALAGQIIKEEEEYNPLIEEVD